MAQSNLLKRISVMSPEEVAAIGYRGLLKGKPVVITDISMFLVLFRRASSRGDGL